MTIDSLQEFCYTDADIEFIDGVPYVKPDPGMFPNFDAPLLDLNKTLEKKLMSFDDIPSLTREEIHEMIKVKEGVFPKIPDEEPKDKLEALNLSWEWIQCGYSFLRAIEASTCWKDLYSWMERNQYKEPSMPLSKGKQ